MRVLVSDDHGVTADALAEFLRKRGHSAAVAAGSAAALTMLNATAFDAAVIDLYVPPPDGLELLTHLREMPALASLPVVLTTAADAVTVAEVRAELPRLGPASLLRKPFDPDELLAELERLTTVKGSTNEGKTL